MQYVANMGPYRNSRYAEEGRVWGDRASGTAEYALELFRREGVKRILVPGAGYGRNTRLFSSEGFEVTGVEISEEAMKLAGAFDPATRFYHASVLDIPVEDRVYDAVYCFNVLHLFRQSERALLIEKCRSVLADSGLVFFTVFSEAEDSFGTGTEIEPNTFESKPGRPVHYFTEEDLTRHFKGFGVIETGLMEDPEEHGEKPHVHVLRYVCARKEGA